jgi:lactate dehydrogenase-like 2-hydroxyacid dehydrogenase
VARPLVLVASRFLLERRQEWDGGYELLSPEDIVAAGTGGGVVVGASGAGAARASGVASQVEVLVSTGDALDPRLVEALPHLKLVASFSTGYAGIDLAHLRSRGITLTSAAGVNAHDVADHAIALLLSWWHGIPRADNDVRAGKWKEGLAPRPSLRGKRAGIVGLGRIGEEIAARATALGLVVSWWGPRPKPDALYARADSLVALARDSDILFVASRAVPASAGQIDAEVLDALGAKGMLVNVSRGLLVDELALIRALETRTIAGAALDVFLHEPTAAAVWKRFDNVVLTPHIAGYTREAGVAMFGQLRENLRRYFAGEALLTPVADVL